jgi:hypothetical protein
MLLAVSQLNDPAGIAALAAGGVAVLALALSLALAVRLRRVRSAQKLVLGGEARDLVAHAAALEREFGTLRDHFEDTARGLHERLSRAERRLDRAIAYRALVRYDAYGEMSGRQSTTIALLDERRSGVVLSSILHRDTARLYAKELHDGEAELELSPEEDEAVRSALAPRADGGPPPAR